MIPATALTLAAELDTKVVPVDADTLEAVAFNYGLAIELDATHAWLTLDGITFTAALAVTS